MAEIGYKKTYKMRSLLPAKKHITVAIPYEVIERQASIHGLSVEEYVEQYVVVAEFNNFEGIHYTFRKADNGGQ